MAEILVIIPPERFRDEELFIPVDVLRREKHTITIASKVVGMCRGSRGGEAESEVLLSDIVADDFDGVLFIGGGGSKLLFRDPDALRLARAMATANKPIGAICLAPVILANAGVLVGRKATVAGTEAATIRSAGAEYCGPGVHQDGRIVTANGPKSSLAFAQRFSSLFAIRANEAGPQKTGMAGIAGAVD